MKYCAIFGLLFNLHFRGSAFKIFSFFAFRLFFTPSAAHWQSRVFCLQTHSLFCKIVRTKSPFGNAFSLVCVGLLGVSELHCDSGSFRSALRPMARKQSQCASLVIRKDAAENPR